MLVVEDGAELVDLECRGGLPDFEVFADRIVRGADVCGYHDPLDLGISRRKFGGNPEKPETKASALLPGNRPRIPGVARNFTLTNYQDGFTIQFEPSHEMSPLCPAHPPRG